MKRISIALIFVFILGLTTTVYAAEPSEKQLEDLKKYGIMTGDPDGNLRLEESITRAETAKMIITALNRVNVSTPDVEKSEFPDVWETHWAKLYINKAKRMGIIDGDENGKFNPEDNIKNEEVVKMLVNILGYKGMAEATGGYPAGYLSVALRTGLTNGLSFKLGEEAKRGDVAVMFANALEIPLMAQIKWSTEEGEEYIIFNGEDGVRKATILSEYWEN